MATYTGTATTTGEGRNGGHITTADGFIDLGLAIPAELGGGGGATNPEQLFAAAWSACFMGAFRRAAAEEKLRPSALEVTADVTLHHEEAGFRLTARLEVAAGGVDEATIKRLAELAHTICPYSKAITGNVPVELSARAL
jgi:lipoyl-dependent peroxiredoxin